MSLTFDCRPGSNPALFDNPPTLPPPNPILCKAVSLLEALDTVLRADAEDAVDIARITTGQLQQALHFLDGRNP